MKRAILLLVFSAACAHYPVNPPLAQPPNLAAGYRWATSASRERKDGTFVILTFSGGGTRAAGLSFAVLEQLDKTKMPDGTSLLDHVDVISSVSGGSFTSMEYGLRGKAMLKTFVDEFLQKPVELMLFKAAVSPRNLVRLLSPNFHRIDVAAEVYDDILFKGTTFAQLQDVATRENRPLIIANATELEIGSHFEWTQDQFDPICSDLSQVHVARAVASSSAFPILLPAMVLNKYDQTVCNYQPPNAWLKAAASDDYANPSRPRYAQELRAYVDKDRRFLHLLDGGIADNIGLRGPYHALISTDTFVPASGDRTGFTLRPLLNDTPGFRHIDRVVVIVINAGTSGPVSLDKSAKEPNVKALIGGIAGVPMDNYSFDSMQELVDLFAGRSHDRVRYYPVLIGFSLLRDADVRNVVNDIGTSFNALSDQQLQGLRSAADLLLHQDPCFQQLMRDVSGQPTAPDQMTCVSRQ